MPVNQLQLKKRLVDEFGFSGRQAEGITEAVTQTEEAGVTGKDLDVLGARLRKMAWRLAVGIVSAVVSILGALIAILEFAAG